jgi:Bacterial membrane protein YfhO
MRKISIKKLFPYLAAILIFLVITLIYFSPLLQGKKLKQDDIIRHKGMSKEIVDFRDKTGEEALWTNSMFGGMPAYQISVKYTSNLFRYLDKALQLNLPRPAGYVFLYFLGFFVLMLVLGVDVWLSIIGAIAFAFSSYFFIILGAGHNSKAHAIAYMAPVLAGIILTYRGKYLWGGLLSVIALALEIQAGHPQITYYLMLVVLVLGFFQLIDSIKEKKLPHFFKATGLLVLVAVFAVLTHLTSLWATYEYGKYTIRGKSELTTEKHNRTGGLDKDYVTAWSYGVDETFSLMIPNVKGGGTDMLGNNEKALENVDPQFRKAIAQSNQYWGDQPFTSGPVYVGAIIIFLFVLGLFVLKGSFRWVLLTATILSIFLSWGKNFMPFTEFFLDCFPGYNKFRAVSMTLVMAELCIPILAVLALDRILKMPNILKEKKNALYISFGITGGLSLMFYLFPNLFFGFLSQAEIQQFAQYRNGGNAAQIDSYIAALEGARVSLFTADAIRSFFYILIAALLIWLYSIQKIGKNVLIALVAVLVLLDMVTVTHRYLNNDNFVRKSKMTNPYQASIADKEIIKDTDPDFRVFNLSNGSPFDDAGTSYFHKSIGGYHGAKLRRYQELIEHGIIPERAKLITAFQSNPDQMKIELALSSLPVLNMLNTKYFIIDAGQAPLQNDFALGNAWFIRQIKFADNADVEIKAIENFKPAEEVFIDKRFEKDVANVNVPDSVNPGSIVLTEYQPNLLTYASNSKLDGFAVFSEIYYPKGWNAYIDGEKAPHVRVNYVLRGMNIPAGEHKIEFKFEPIVYSIGETISLISSILVFLVLIGAVFFEFKSCRLKKA